MDKIRVEKETHFGDVVFRIYINNNKKYVVRVTDFDTLAYTYESYYSRKKGFYSSLNCLNKNAVAKIVRIVEKYR